MQVLKLWGRVGGREHLEGELEVLGRVVSVQLVSDGAGWSGACASIPVGDLPGGLWAVILGEVREWLELVHLELGYGQAVGDGGAGGGGGLERV